MTLDPVWLETALLLTGSFKTGNSDPFAEVHGGVPGQGLACGILQWDIGHGSLQPLVRAAGEAAVMDHMPVRGSEFWHAVNTTIPQALTLLRPWHIDDGDDLDSQAEHELAAFLASPAMRAQQIHAASHIGDHAYREAQAWVRQSEDRAPTKREFCWFFDLITQSGGLKGLRLQDVRGLIELFGEMSVDDAICNWLKLREHHQTGYEDCHKNEVEWRDKIPHADIDLFVLSYLRALKTVFISQGRSLNRKATLAAGHGWVNGRFFDLTDQLH